MHKNTKTIISTKTMSLTKTTLEMRYNHIFPMPSVGLCNNNTKCVGVDHMLIQILGMPLPSPSGCI